MTAVKFPQGNYTDGQVLFNKGDIAERFYMIQQGSVKMVDPDTGTNIAELTTGDSFGEQAILSGGVRSASAVAKGDVTCLEITTDVLKRMLAQEPGLITPTFQALLLQLYMRNAIAGKNGMFHL
ncbi:MAG: cyclic nucleotide-binding domain-containing protein [Burkholderiaceae bacterium]|jgi:CRP-like cAMP-binding protein|tara:strand:+ start:93 stop:464 length:372 start_codon:yes stop_codon:yes gene_type:complete